MNPLLKQFVEETREFLEDAAAGLLSLEKDPTDTDAMDRVFRAMHSTKGGSGLFDLDPMTSLVHEAENLLDEVRQGERSFSGALVDQLLTVLDQVNRWVDAVERDEVLPEGASARSRELIQGLRQAAGDEPAAAEPAAAPGGDDAAAAAPTEAQRWQPEWLEQVPDSERRRLVARVLDESGELTGFTFTPESGAFFTGADPLLVVREVPALEWLNIQPRAPWGDLDSFDPYDCRLVFQGLALEQADAVADAFTFEDDETLRCEPVSVQALVFAVGESGDRALLEEFLAAAPQQLQDGDIDGLRRGATAMQRMVSEDLREGSLLAWLDVLLARERLDLAAPLLQELGIEPPAGDQVITMHQPEANAVADLPGAGGESAPVPDAPVDETAVHEVLNEQLAMLGGTETDADDRAARVDSAGRVIRRCLVALGHGTDGLDEALEQAGSGDLEPLRRLIQGGQGGPGRGGGDSGGGGAAAGAGDGGGERVAKSFRVDAESIDLLGDLVGELVVAKNSFPFLAERAENEYGVRELARELKERFNVINRIAQDMQGAVMQVQMLPVQQVFQRFPRLVRDLSRRLDKEVELVMEGEQTEADKTVIEVLGEPLTHMVRNSIDHGIEMPDERQAAGKPRCGTVRLTAGQEGENVIIEVTDDGGGLDPEAIRNKAISKGIVGESEAARLGEQESLQLIFAPGFSTRDAVSDVSGRGVGMDVVRSTVNRYGGSVSVASEKGQGTRLRLAMPLTMAVSYVMGVQVAGQLFGVPMESVVETVRLPQSAVRHVKKEEAVVLRDQVIPLRRLDRLLMLESSDNDVRERVDANYDEPQVTILVVRQSEGSVGLVVDDFQEGLDVIVKPLEGVLASVRAYSGTALLGDGRVLLVLNLRELL